MGGALSAWRDGLVRDLGGESAISMQQRAMIDLCVRTYLILEHIDRWMLANQAIINRRNRTLFPIARHRQRYADSLSKYLQALGLEKRQPPAEDLTSYLERQNYGDTDDE